MNLKINNMGDGSITAEIVQSISCRAVEIQDNLIMNQMLIIGGEEFLDITIDKNKLIEALTLYRNLVRCKDCFRYDNDTGICRGPVGFPASLKKPDEYCSRGVRRTV